MAPRIPGLVTAALLALALVPAPAAAETITLKDGRVVAGTLVGGTASTLEVRTDLGILVLDRADVVSVAFGPVPGTAAPSPAPAAPAAAPTPAPAYGAPYAPEDPSVTRERLRLEAQALKAAEAREARRASEEREAALRPFLDRGGAGARIILNPYTSIRVYQYGDGGLFQQGAPDFVGGLGVFAEYMSRIVGGGLEVAAQFVSVQRIYERGRDQWGDPSGPWTSRDATAQERRTGVLLHVWPYLRVRIPTRVVDPYFKLSFGYANYVRSFERNGPFDGVAISPVFGAVFKVRRDLGILAELGYSFTHLEPRYPMEPDDYSIKFHNLALNLGVMYRF